MKFNKRNTIMRRYFFVIINIKIRKIQELRVIQAIAETNFAISVSKKQAFKLAPLKEFFKMNSIE